MTLLTTSSRSLHFPLTLSPVIIATKVQMDPDSITLRWASLFTLLNLAHQVYGLSRPASLSQAYPQIPGYKAPQEGACPSPLQLWLPGIALVLESAQAECLPRRMLEEFMERIFWH